MNQGCIPSIFSVTGIYIAILFYFKYNEVLSKPKLVGIALMTACVVILSLDKKSADESQIDLDQDQDETSETLTVSQMRMYGLFAVAMGLTAPFFWTIKAFYTRKSIQDKIFHSTWDLAIDSKL